MDQTKRFRRTNWSAEENDKLELALQKYGRNDVTRVHQYLQKVIPNFDREERDVKKKIYNYLQENIHHEASVKVRTCISYAVLMLYLETHPFLEDDANIIQISKFCSHDLKRVQKNVQELRADSSVLRTGRTAVVKVMEKNGIRDAVEILKNDFYTEVLNLFNKIIDGR
ncbi:Conserved_hypothetical protein [Hexamita inflata]|uniref:Myb-like domain-containing protein n=1 Tax=Hexamita inflata TaxID=28002 RepID=A0AA86P9F8_9EUKA|nr:Conserved hypothetical protein [Hexamita inflata]CAI9934694.1 Conserved hypothetical protein [Hexamita inflata]